MLKLKTVSKFYYNKGVVASGFSKVSVDFEMGEFVVITGESGSGKSTLLNVISGLDTYEEGEMYINGKETSHYGESDFEEYRKKYIGNIFQNFNLVNSYTVYQNIELILLLNGYKRKECKKRVLEIIEKTGLTKFKRTKASKLSGGQKQRVAIARALAKDTPIIVADEPTGNLDSVAAKEIIELLYQISKYKLVIIVTHNYEDFEKYATRKIRMHDGKIIEDKKLKEKEEASEYNFKEYKNIRFFSKLMLGIRNTFNIIPKFILLFLVYIFITFAVSAEYSTLQKQKEVTEKAGYNAYFQNTSDKRIVIKKNDNAVFEESDYTQIKDLANIDKIVKDDLLLDTNFSMSDDYYYLYGNVLGLDFIETEIDHGKMPENDYEIIIEGNQGDYYFRNPEELLNKEFNFMDDYGNKVINSKVKIVGMIIREKVLDLEGTRHKFYVSDKVLSDLRFTANKNYSDIETLLNDVIYKSDEYNSYYKVVPNSNVPMSEAYISEDMNYLCPKFKCVNNNMTIYVNNLYYKDNKNVNITKTYNKNNYKNLTGLEDYDYRNGEFYINPTDYNNMFNKGTYQSSVFVKDKEIVRDTMKELNNLGFKTMYVSDALIKDTEFNQILAILRTVVVIILIVVLFFVSYFIIKLILKSRNIYFSTIRMLGASKKTSNDLLKIDLFTVINIAFICYISFILLVNYNYIKFDYMKNLITYLNVYNYLIIYIILIIMSYLIANRFSRKLFKKSAMKTYRDEVNI